MSPTTDVSREAMDGLADAILDSHDPDEAPGPAPRRERPYDHHVDGLATACLQVWADGEGDDEAEHPAG